MWLGRCRGPSGTRRPSGSARRTYPNRTPRPGSRIRRAAEHPSIVLKIAGAAAADRNASVPQICREGVREPADDSILQPVVLDSQGELQLIAQEGRLRLDPVDRPHKEKIDGAGGR